MIINIANIKKLRNIITTYDDDDDDDANVV